MPTKCEIKVLKAIPAASIRTTTSVSNLPGTIGEAYKAINIAMGENGVNCTEAPFVIYYNMDMQALDVEMGYPVSAKVAEKGMIKNSVVPAGKAVSFTHVGPYNEMEKTYNEALEWIKQNNLDTNGIVCEFYKNDPAVTPPEKLITEIYIYLKN